MNIPLHIQIHFKLIHNPDYLILNLLFFFTDLYEEKFRSWQGSNLRSQRETDFKSDALTTRPQLLPIDIIIKLFIHRF